MSCSHENFRCECDVTRLSDHTPMRFTVDVRVQCVDCNERFVFQGLPEGCDINVPMMGVFGSEARLPIRPASEEYREVIAPMFRIRRQ